MTRWADAAGHPPGSALVAAGYVGVLVYAGTPGRAKNVTGPVLADYLAHGLQVAAVYEDGAGDISSGAGAAHAHSIMADLLAVGATNATPICVAADEHLTAGQLPTAASYQADFYGAAKAAGWVGPVGGYGFAEYTHAISTAGVADWLWQCGSAADLWPGVHLWQRNDGTAVVGGVQIDINEQYLPLEDDMAEWTNTIGHRKDGTAVSAGDALLNLYLGAYYGGGDAGAKAVFPTVNDTAATVATLKGDIVAAIGPAVTTALAGAEITVNADPQAIADAVTAKVGAVVTEVLAQLAKPPAAS